MICRRENPECRAYTDLPDGDKGAMIDRCLLPELRAMWEQGIQTVCCCCGHGETEAYIRVKGEYAGTMREMGYEECEHHACVMYEGTAAFRPKCSIP